MVDTIIAVDIAIIPMFTIIVLMNPSQQITNQLINTLLEATFIPWIVRISSSVWLAAIICGLAIITHATDQHHSWTVSMVGDRT